MKYFYFFAFCLGSLIIISAAGSKKLGCLEKEKALTLLETAETLLTKATDSFPSCREEINSTDQSECGSKKPLAYIEISKKLISDVRENFPTFPTCPKVIVKYDKPRDCFEVSTFGHKKSGIYTIWPREPFTAGKPLDVYCDMETDGGGWTLIHRRGKFPVQQDFYQDWESYKNGFGNVSEEFWLGNENIRVLCHMGCEIRFDLQDKNGVKGFAIYKNFKLSGNNYHLNISGYTGNVGDCMQYHNNYDFSTKDKGNTQSAIKYKSGWWHLSGYESNLNGIYGGNGYETFGWYRWRSNYDNLESAVMRVKPK